MNNNNPNSTVTGKILGEKDGKELWTKYYLQVLEQAKQAVIDRTPVDGGKALDKVLKDSRVDIRRLVDNIPPNKLIEWVADDIAVSLTDSIRVAISQTVLLALTQQDSGNIVRLFDEVSEKIKKEL